MTMGPRATARRNNLLQAAARLIARKGVEHVTIDDLVAEAGISRATFYRAFSSRDEVMEALYERYERGVLERLVRDLADVDGPGLAAVVDGVLADHAEQGAFIRAMLREELRPGRGPSSQHARVMAQVDHIASWWTERTGTPADRGRIQCMVLLLQSAGTFSAGLEGEARTTLRDALVAVLQAIVVDYQASL